ncbi:MAG: ABC transporter permease [Bacillota bacterium]|jgi:simple sugar transport system permease protein|nr:ABC transporter permease [Candidatus Fermentithermobacillaceae bacterium]HAF66655.1 ABC transporter permease [Clostridiales bacterium UBA9857]HOA71522.1 ABC transporter permease [Bacillota bacterium]HOP71442.1 ABC transporter permease [Bacillota bacterium]HPT36280.1 ABC transporter permease [Bacillota bacterium]
MRERFQTEGRFRPGDLLRRNAVPILFLFMCVLGVLVSGQNIRYIAHELVSRLARNWFLVLSLIIPVTAGLGLNFAIVLGAMAGQVGLIVATHYKIPGLLGLAVAVILSLPIAVLLGMSAGHVLNQARGREMITSMMLGFFANGLYQLVFLFMVGTVIPLNNPEIMLDSGVGLRGTVELKYCKYALDNLLKVRVLGVNIPVATFAVVAALCLGIRWLYKTKLGQELRAVGQDMAVASVAGINVARTRIIAMVMSTVLAAIGQVIFLQNMGVINTFNSHEQIGTVAIASILVGGASVTSATVGHALIGTLLFQLLFIVSPSAGQRLMGNAQVGEFFRVFIGYGIIAVALLIHSWERKASLERASRQPAVKGEAKVAGSP